VSPERFVLPMGGSWRKTVVETRKLSNPITEPKAHHGWHKRDQNHHNLNQQETICSVPWDHRRAPSADAATIAAPRFGGTTDAVLMTCALANAEIKKAAN
jgi:hypothetical protein